MGSLLLDIRHALRAFRSGRSALLLSAAVLALAIGAGTTTYSVVSGVALRSLPYAEPDRLVSARVVPLERRATNSGGATLSRQSLELLLAPAGAFEAAAYMFGSGEPVLTGSGEPERVSGFRVAPSFFAVLGAQARLGRTFVPEDGEEGGRDVVVLSHRFWMSRFGGAPDVIGRTLSLDGRIHEVVGVMPPRFEYPAGTQLWQPAPALAPITSGAEYIQGRYWLVGRLAPGLTPEQARARLDAPFAAHALEHPGFTGWGPNLTPLTAEIIGEIRKPLLMLLGAVALVILIACANVAAVLLARGVHRRRELAIRVSLGASRGRVARQLLVEAVLLALAGGAAGVLLAYLAVPATVSLIGDQLPRAAEIAVDARVLAAAVVASTITGLLAGLLPSVVAVTQNLTASLKDGGAGGGMSSWRVRAGEALVVTQVGLGTLVLAGAALLTLSFAKLMRVDLGFDHAHVVTAELRLPTERYRAAEQRQAFLHEVLERTRGLPAVQAVAVSDGIPFRGAAFGTVTLPGAETPPGAPPTWFTTVSPEYFQVLGMGVLRGRAFRQAGAEEPDAVVVNEAFVRHYFPNEDPIGRTIQYFGSRDGRIIGVVTDTRQNSPAQVPPPQLYASLGSDNTPYYVKLSARTTGSPSATGSALRGIIHAADPLLAVDRVGPLTDRVLESVARQRFFAILLGAFSTIALLITALGLYGLTAYTVSRRTREIGIRIALGATPAHVRAATIGRTARLAVAGLLLGLAGAAAATRTLEALLFDLSPRDPTVFGAVAVLLAAVAMIAAYAPARRAARVDPMTVLRAE